MNDLTAPAVDAVQACEDATVQNPGEEKVHGRLLTEEEWAKQTPPFNYIKVQFDTWTNLEYEVALKYLLKNATGWVYYRDRKFIIEKLEDATLFRLWISKEPMVEDSVLDVS